MSCIYGVIVFKSRCAKTASEIAPSQIVLLCQRKYFGIAGFINVEYASLIINVK